MKNRMHSWGSFCNVMGWIGMVLGVLCLLFAQFGGAIALIVSAIGCWFCRAVLDWMDDLMAQLIASRESTSLLLEEVYQLRRQVAASHGEANPESPRCESENTETTASEGGSRRRRPVQ